MAFLEERSRQLRSARGEEGWVQQALQGVREHDPGRNETCKRLVGYFLNKHTTEVVEQMLLAWDQLNEPPMGPATIKKTVGSVKRTIERRGGTMYQQGPAQIPELVEEEGEDSPEDVLSFVPLGEYFRAYGDEDAGSKLDAEVKKVVAEKKLQYHEAMEVVRASQPELFKSGTAHMQLGVRR